MNENQQIYETAKVVNIYKGLKRIFPPEQVLLKILEKKPQKASMLDLGIGGGRTTFYFSPLFTQYVGVDFSIGMIETSRKRFQNNKNARFIHSDVTLLPRLSLGTFDFILYSLNGIDYLKNLEERTTLFSNIYQSLNASGIFAFSAHNTNALKRLYTFQWPRRNPYRIITEYQRQKKLREINGPMSNFTGKDFFQIYDGCEYFKAYTCYIAPALQIELLKNAGFTKIEIAGIKGESVDIDQAATRDDDWLHYFCYKD